MNYPRNPQRRSQNWGVNNQGRMRPQGGGRPQGDYKPNTAALRLNHDRTSDRQPLFRGAGNVVINGQQMTIFVSAWINADERTGEDKLRLVFTDPASVEGQNQGGGYQQQPRNNGYRQNGGGYQPQGQNGAYAPNGAMSRARPVPPAQYEGHYNEMNPPAYDDVPDGPQYPVNEEAPY
jgi:hypothetical protein